MPVLEQVDELERVTSPARWAERTVVRVMGAIARRDRARAASTRVPVPASIRQGRHVSVMARR
jgi:hypothetical protein